MGNQWTEKEVVHLLHRATFTATPKEVAACVGLGKEETVRRLLIGQSLTGEERAIPPINEIKSDGMELVGKELAAQQLYWLYRMMNSSAQLTEKMTLFWHGHFATSYRKVNVMDLMLRQNSLFRKYALGNFRELVLEMGQDPAMMLWLDSNSNKKNKPNENYAREVMELFTLGIGNYTEEDIKEAARAFTGWTVKRETGDVSFNMKQHDTGMKHVLGETANFDEKSVVDVLFKQEALPKFLATKLLKFFATPAPSEEWVSKVASDFMKSQTIGEVLRNLFLSDEFYDDSVRLSLIKSPTEYVVGIMRALDLPLSKNFTSAMRKMGQELFLPPDVAGWEGGVSWLMSSNLISRYQFAESVAKKLKATAFTSSSFTPDTPDSGAEWVSLWAKNLGVWEMGQQTNNVLARYAEDTFIHAKSKNNGMRGLLQLIMLSPEIQMK